MSRHEDAVDDDDPVQPLDEPILRGTARTDYERYLNTNELLVLQKSPSEWVHRDELLFQVTHQSSELWLKLCVSDTEETASLLERGDVSSSLRLLRRAQLCLRFCTEQLDMLEQMSPWEYQEIRKVLGHGSGFDSPGFRRLRRVLPRLRRAFDSCLDGADLSLVDLYKEGRGHEDLYQLAEALIELDERQQLWRIRHYRVVARVIGDGVVGTQGTPVELLGRLVREIAFPALWDVRNALTAHSANSR